MNEQSDRPSTGIVDRCLRALSAAPATIPAIAALAVFVWWAADQGGQPVTVWGPGALIVLGRWSSRPCPCRSPGETVPVTLRVAIVS